MRFKKILSWALVITFFLLPSTAKAFMFEGPAQISNHFPLFISLNQPFLEQASTENSFSVGLSHSSVFMLKASALWSAKLDMELTQINIRYKKDLGRLEIGMDIPVLRATGGFLDRPLDWYHRASGFPDYDRNERARNEFLYTVKKDGDLLIQGDNDRTGFGDLRINFRTKLIDKAGFVAGLLTTIELPTGNAKVGYGNGSVDAGLALLMDQYLSDNTRTYANAGMIFPGDLKAYQTVNMRSFYHAGAGIEYLYQHDFSLLSQLMFQTSPYPKTGISEIDTAAMLVVLGGRYYAAAGSFELSLTEDLNTSGAPDFILNLTYKIRL